MFVSLNIVFCFLISIGSVHPTLQEKNPRVGLLQAAVVTAYSTYLVWSALSSQPASMGCSSFPISQPSSNDGVSLFFGVGFTFLALIYSALRVSSSTLTPEQQKESKKQKERLLATLAHEDDLDNEKGEDKTENQEEMKNKTEEDDDDIVSIEEDDQKVAYNYSFFHFTFLLAAMYLGMVLTNWQSIRFGTGDGLPADTILVDQGTPAVWIKVISSWVTLLLFIWTMLAPVLLPNRKFWD